MNAKVVKVCAVLTTLMSLCIDAHAQGTPAGDNAAVGAYVTMALDKLETSHINRGSVDWKGVREAAIARAKGATKTEDAYPIIEEVLTKLGERHSFFVPPRPPPRPQETDLNQPEPLPQVLARTVVGAGYINVPGFAVPGERYEKIFATRIRDLVVNLDEKGMCGWIVDLRHNTGGNMMPGLLGLGPMLGEGMLGGADSIPPPILALHEQPVVDVRRASADHPGQPRRRTEESDRQRGKRGGAD